MLLAGAAAWSTPGPASASEPDTARFTTRLHPGWNMVGWIEPDTTTAALFGAMPALDAVYVWDSGERAYRTVQRGSTAGGIDELSTGMGVWLYIRSDAPVAWERAVSDQSALLSLTAGHNLVAWLGPDETPIEAALARFGDALVGAASWDAEVQRYARYRRDAPDAVNTLRRLRLGDALWLELASETWWWQSGAERRPVDFTGAATDGIEPRFVFSEDVPAGEQQSLRAVLDGVREVFSERFGADRGDLTVRTGSDAGRCSGGRGSVTLPRGCAGIPWIVAHEYFHHLQGTLAGPNRKGPVWMTEGTAVYADRVYDGVADPDSTPEAALEIERRNSSRKVASTVSTLARVATGDTFRIPSEEPLNYSLGFLAADWLVAHTSERAIAEYYRLVSESERWDVAFEAAFGVDVDDFYSAFEIYRAEAAPPLPHLTDGDGPVAVFLGDVSPGTRAAIQAEMSGVQRFLIDRFAAEPPGYTVYVGADAESVRGINERFFSPRNGEYACGSRLPGVLVYETSCLRHLTDNRFVSAYFSVLHYNIHHAGPVPPWLAFGASEYVLTAYRTASGRASHD
ncbi:MAG: hypothetical protein F4020_06815, partial [Gammaproteobacteria bacterium]|nr:hypothetical protein [Gammaproteobacteria bacterium]